MEFKLVRSAMAAMAAGALTLALAACGGSGDGGDEGTSAPPPSPPAVSVREALASLAAAGANDTARNPAAPFSSLQSAGVPAVVIQGGAPKVSFAVFSDGKVKTDLALSNVTLAIAKLVPGGNGAPDQWVNYIYRKEIPNAGVGPGGKPVLANALQAATDPKQADPALAAAQLVYNGDGYYTYTFRADITNPGWTATSGSVPYSVNGVAYEPGRTHRVTIALNYVDGAGQTIRVNPYFDFTIDSNGRSVPAGPSQTRRMVDIATCNTCHDKLSLHGNAYLDTQFCVMCHNPGSADANSGNVLTLSTMVHKIHAGRMLHEKGEDYAIWGYFDVKYDYSEVGLPQPLRNCAKCHDGANAATPQGDNWKRAPSKQACLSCHVSGADSSWYSTHVQTLKLAASAAAVADSSCRSCHDAGSALGADKVHWVQELADAALYEGRIESAVLKKAATATSTGLLTVKYSVVNPATGTAYDLREGCSGTPTTDFAGASIPSCNANYRWDAQMDRARFAAPPNKFGMFTIQVGAETLAGVTADDVTAIGAGWAMYRGADDGAHHYTADIQVPAGAKGNARVLMTGSVAERRLDPASRTPVGAVPAATSADVAYVPVKNAIREVDVATGAASSKPRRQIVSNDKCNNCHAMVGLPTGGGKKPDFHKGLRNNSEGCSICHNAALAAGYTLMTDGSTAPVAGDSLLATGNTSSFLHESYQSKRFIHGIHGTRKRTYPFTHCMNVGGEYNKDGTSKVAGSAPLGSGTCLTRPDGSLYPGVTTNFSAEVAYPGRLSNCAACHVADSWKQDRSVLGAVVFKQTGMTDPLNWQVISPKAATCTSCHDSKAVQTHVKTNGASFGTATQKDLLYGGAVFESCEGCHAPGRALGVDEVHSSRKS